MKMRMVALAPLSHTRLGLFGNLVKGGAFYAPHDGRFGIPRVCPCCDVATLVTLSVISCSHDLCYKSPFDFLCGQYAPCTGFSKLIDSPALS